MLNCLCIIILTLKTHDSEGGQILHFNKNSSFKEFECLKNYYIFFAQPSL